MRNHPFTLVVCTRCAGRLGDALLEEFRSVVRRCPQGMLVSTECMLSSAFCATRPLAGAIVMLQPCAIDRSPTGPGRWIGPIVDADIDAVCVWIQDGRWDLTDLPQHLQNPRAAVSYASQLN